MAVAFRSLIRVTDGTKRSLTQNYMLKTTFRARINYKSSSSLIGDENRKPFRRTNLNVPIVNESSQFRKLHLSRVQSAEIVKFHLSDIGK